METFIRAQSAPWHRSVELYIGSTDRKTRVKEIILESIDEGSEMPPSFSLDLKYAQTLMDDLWNCGLRPTEGTGSAGSLAATQRHLEDMRTLVFKTPARIPQLREGVPNP
jgi:hypothetical protein